METQLKFRKAASAVNPSFACATGIIQIMKGHLLRQAFESFVGEDQYYQSPFDDEIVQFALICLSIQAPVYFILIFIINPIQNLKVRLQQRYFICDTE